jgi:hypothetical protein
MSNKIVDIYEGVCPNCQELVKAVLVERTRHVRPKDGQAIPYTKIAYACPKCVTLFATPDVADENIRRASEARRNWMNEHDDKE